MNRNEHTTLLVQGVESGADYQSNRFLSWPSPEHDINSVPGTLEVQAMRRQSILHTCLRNLIGDEPIEAEIRALICSTVVAAAVVIPLDILGYLGDDKVFMGLFMFCGVLCNLFCLGVCCLLGLQQARCLWQESEPRPASENELIASDEELGAINEYEENAIDTIAVINTL